MMIIAATHVRRREKSAPTVVTAGVNSAEVFAVAISAKETENMTTNTSRVRSFVVFVGQ